MEIICPSAHTLIRKEVNQPDKIYKIFQQSGQKFVQTLEQFQEPEGRTEVYACNFARDMGVQQIFKFFAVCGDILQLRLLMDFSGYNRGKCFVLYRTVRGSRKAISCLNDELLGSTPIYVKLSLNNTELLFKHIPPQISEQTITDWVTSYIGRGLETLVIKPSRHNSSEKIAFLTYCNHSCAIMAHKVAWPYVKIAGVAMDVHWVSPELFRKARNLYFRNYSANMSKFEFFERITAVIVHVDTIINIRLKNKFGYITFGCFKSMKQAYDLLTSTTFVIENHRIAFSRTPFMTEAMKQTRVETGQARLTQPIMPSFPLQPPSPETLHVSAYPLYQQHHHYYMPPVVGIPAVTYCYVPVRMASGIRSFGPGPVSMVPVKLLPVAKPSTATTTVVRRMTTVYQSSPANSSVVIEELDDCREKHVE